MSHFYKDKDKLEKLRKIWEPRKEYIEKDLWVIRNFLSEEEIKWLDDLAREPDHWYATMRSPYGGNTRNKFIGYDPLYREDGVMLLPGMPGTEDRYFATEYHGFGIDHRIAAIVPPQWSGAGAFQSFFEVPDEQIIAELGHNVDFAMDFHYEQDEDHTGVPPGVDVQKNIMTAAISIYVNDDYDGGILEFKNKDYSIEPEPGMLVHIPLYKEFEHRITKVTNGNRHTLYGKSWLNESLRHSSTNDDC
jgi:hypothetical protein